MVAISSCGRQLIAHQVITTYSTILTDSCKNQVAHFKKVGGWLSANVTFKHPLTL